MAAVDDLQTWADDLEVIRLPHIESEIAVLQINTSDTATLLSQKAQEFNDRLDTHTVQIAAAQDDADTAGVDAFTALTRIGQTGIDAITYTDQQIQLLRNDLQTAFANQFLQTQDHLQNLTIDEISAALPDLQTEINGAINQVNGIRDQISQLKADIEAGIDNLTVSIIPGIEERLTSADGTAVAARDSYTLLATDYEHQTLVAGFDELHASIGNVSAALSTDYYTQAQTDSAIAAQVTTLNSRIDGTDADVTALSATLTNEYYTKTATNSAISAQVTTLNSRIDSTNSDLSALDGDVTSLSANLSNYYLTKTDTEGAIAVAKSDLQAEIDGVESTVTTQGAAIVDLDNNAKAGYLIKAKAGSAVSLLELIAADGSTGTVSVAKISAAQILLDGTVYTRHLAAGSVTADKASFASLQALSLTVDTIDMIQNAVSENAWAYRSGQVDRAADSGWFNYTPITINPSTPDSYDLYIWQSMQVWNMAVGVQLGTTGRIAGTIHTPPFNVVANIPSLAVLTNQTGPLTLYIAAGPAFAGTAGAVYNGSIICQMVKR